MRNFINICILFSCCIASALAVAGDDISSTLAPSQKWLMPANECPADVVGTPKDINYEKGFCSGRVEQCLSSCKSGSGHACYNLALELQATKQIEYQSYYEALFLRSCKLGALSGCTNRAAGIEVGAGEPMSKACSVKTYESICKLGDPWSCTMFGFHLMNGDGVKKDFEKAKAVMRASCKYGKDDPACAYAEAILKKFQGTAPKP